jgi:hypothetical protein
MALARVQGTGKVRLNSGSPLVITFSTPPSVGNAVIVTVINRRTAGPILPASLTDSKGNTYAQSVALTFSTEAAAIYCCASVGTSGAPFTITINAGGGLYAGAAVEVSGVGTGLVLNQSATANTSGTTITAGPTAALTAAEVILAGVFAYNTGLTSSTVEALSPAWGEEFEELDYTNFGAGEGDTRLLASGALGTTPRAQWTVTGISVSARAVIAAFTASGVAPPAVATAASYVWGPL